MEEIQGEASPMERFNIRTRKAGLAACSAMAMAVLAGCSGHAPLASSGSPVVSGERAETQLDQDVARAEERVAKSPRSAAARVTLAQAYLAAGRFESAVTTFDDAISLGDNSPRTGLGQALAYIGAGRNAEAVNVLSRWRDQIPASDLGLALALAGQPGQAVGLLSDAVRGGDDSAKTRQNLAYAYALDGRWAEARVVASQDVSADQIDARLSEWASRARPEQYQVRVAGLLGAPVRSDAGQPAALALNGAAPAARVASAEVPAPAPVAELPPVDAGQSAVNLAQSEQPAMVQPEEAAPVPSSFATSAVAVSQPAKSAKFVSQPKVQRTSPVRSALAESAVQGTHLVQLGSFSTLENAHRAWGIFVTRNPALKDHALRITEAEVGGHHYFRVAAEGFDRGSAQTLCSNVKQRGYGCLAYAQTHALPGAMPGKAPAGPMLASR